MDGWMIGIDLCDEYTQVSCAKEEQAWTIPTAICRSKQTEEWYVGEEAYAHTLVGDGLIVDKLVSLAGKGGTATLCEIRYEAQELLTRFIEKILEFPKKECSQKEQGGEQICQLVISVRKMEPKLLDALYISADALGISRDRVHIISHTESFVYYILSQKKDIWNGLVGMFDLAENQLRYYELKVQRGLKKTTVLAEYEQLEEGFALDILETASGAKLGDRILCSCGERLMQKKMYSAVFLSGKGFLKREWAEEFMKMLCSRRRVYMEPAMFARGAALKAGDYENEVSAYPYVCICEGRLKTTVSMNVIRKGQETSVVVAAAGDSWYERRATLEVITDRQDAVEFLLTPADSGNKKLVSIPLEGFPKRPERTTRVQVQISFLDEKTMSVTLKDEGFGELFPSSGIQIRQEVRL